MKLAVYSDVHLEFSGGGTIAFWTRVAAHAEKNPGATCILAGDIINWRKLQDAAFVLEHFKSLYREVIYVPGNHESFRMAIPDSNARVENYARELGFHYLRPGHEVTIGSQRFLGGTLWYANPGDRPDLAWFYDRQVHPSLEPAYQHNREFVEDVCQVMTPKDVVVSHHLPHPRSVAPQWAMSEVNCYFLSDQSKWIAERSPKLWIHGHTHRAFDYTVKGAQGPTRIYCNPQGYANEHENPDFWERVSLDC